ncbi:MAG: hypothetical protein JWM76_474 [Pseudonocardiales bacterium]|nr:hypothetical protein [Pseudonocardiales bacterium]
MSPDYVVRTVPSVRLVAQTATLHPAQLADHIGPMFDTVAAELRPVPGALNTPIATYAETDTGMDVVVGYVYDGPPPAGTEVKQLPEARAVCGVHLGPMRGIQTSWQGLHQWVLDNGYGFAGPCREVHLRAESEDQADWITELQQPIF